MERRSPAPVEGSAMSEEKVTIRAKDGECAAYVYTPSAGEGPWPAVIFYTDAFGIRPAMKQMAQHVADGGYVVVMPDLFYRHGPYGPLVPKDIFASGDWAPVMALMGSTDNLRAAEDAASLIAYLDARRDVAGKAVGTVGFCMGGGMALTTAAYYPDRIAAAVSFHGGNLATDAPTSPHRQFPKIKGEVLVAGADKDQYYPPEMHQQVIDALSGAGVKFDAKIYEGKLHGWMKPDLPVYDAQAAERGWAEMFALYKRALH
jgi:carboxymethylenebutenolidase